MFRNDWMPNKWIGLQIQEIIGHYFGGKPIFPQIIRWNIVQELRFDWNKDFHKQLIQLFGKTNDRLRVTADHLSLDQRTENDSIAEHTTRVDCRGPYFNVKPKPMSARSGIQSITWSHETNVSIKSRQMSQQLHQSWE